MKNFKWNALNIIAVCAAVVGLLIWIIAAIFD
jgi:hypothetical protein